MTRILNYGGKQWYIVANSDGQMLAGFDNIADAALVHRYLSNAALNSRERDFARGLLVDYEKSRLTKK